MARSKVAASHVEWLSLVETSGVFLTVPVVKRVFPNGIGAAADDLRSELRLRLASASQTQGWATTWTRWVLRDLLGLEQALLEGPAVPERATHVVAEHGVLLRPEYAVADLESGPEGRTLRMLVLAFPYGTARDRPFAGDRWAATPIERAFTLQRATGVPLVMATDGDWFSVVSNPAGGTATSATWVSSIFGEEPVLLDSFVALLGARRFFAVDTPNTLPAMLAESAQAQEEVTSRLGTQVRQAVELLVGALSRANRARKGELLADVSAETVYAAALTVMMRTVFLLYAEERDLLPAREALYADSYGVLGLRERLQAEADRFGDEALERRSAGWHQLLAAFRAIHGGIEHEALRLPAYGGGLFDPDRYPFLEGRRAEEAWRTHDSRPLPVDDRSVLAILDALQILSFRDGGVTEARRLSYRSLDVEQIGHVYEGLLDHGAVKVDQLAVGLKGSGGDGPELALELIELAAAKGDAALRKFLVDQTGRSAAQIEKGLTTKPGPDLIGKVRSACEHDDGHVERVLPYVGLMEEDLRGLPMVFMPGSVYVTSTTERRDTGTQYTPKDLADEIVRYALEPLVYAPGPADDAEPADWRIKRPDEILALRVCDPAVGSGAILVAACRFLSERLIESARAHEPVDGQTRVLTPDDPDVALVARRLIVDRCLYGVDRNPLAVEMSKLSLWLVTLAKERPFTFLDHAIQIGDSLVGVTDLDQVRYVHLDPVRGRHQRRNLLAVADSIEPLVAEALNWIRAMRAVNPVTVADVEEQRAMSLEAERALDRAKMIADAVVGEALASMTPGTSSLDERMQLLSASLSRALDRGRPEAERNAVWDAIATDALYALDTDRPPLASPRRPLHWPLAFPEVMAQDGARGFDVIVGNPPFGRGRAISGRDGFAYREYLVEHVAKGDRGGSTDLVAYFLRRSAALTARAATVGLFATKTISQGDTREAGLEALVQESWTIYRAVKSMQWPGSAAVDVALVWLTNATWMGTRTLDGTAVQAIDDLLQEGAGLRQKPLALRRNADQAFQGVIHLGAGFLLEPQEALEIIESDDRYRDVLYPALGGDDLMRSPSRTATRWIIDFGDRSEREARGYPVCWDIAESRVLPERSTKDASRYPRMVEAWWQFWNPRPALRKAIAGLSQVIVIPQTSTSSPAVRVSAQQVFLQTLVVFAHESDFMYGTLASSVHWWWALTYGSTMRAAGLRYAPSDLFETFPLPTPSEEVGLEVQALDAARFQLQADRGIGLSRVSRLVDDVRTSDRDVVALRRRIESLDAAVLRSYGWADINCSHAFDDLLFGPRYTLQKAVREEALRRLLRLNHERYAREQAEQATGVKPARKRKGSAPGQTSMLGED